MHSMKAINRKARKVEAALIEATGDVQALQRRGGEGKIYYPMGCTLNFTPDGKSIFPAALPASANPWSVICSIAIWDVAGPRKCPTT